MRRERRGRRCARQPLPGKHPGYGAPHEGRSRVALKYALSQSIKTDTPIKMMSCSGDGARPARISKEDPGNVAKGLRPRREPLACMENWQWKLKHSRAFSTQSLALR